MPLPDVPLPDVTVISFDRGAHASGSTTPLASNPAAAPATVGSVRLGNTLFVPVDIGTSVASGQTPAIVRLVPSPPSVTSTLTSRARIASTARIVSVGETVAPTSTISISASMRRSVSAPVAMPNGSAMATIRVAPAVTAPMTARAIRLRLSSVVDTAPRAATRRTSRPETGLAMIPTVPSGEMRPLQEAPCPECSALDADPAIARRR